MEIQDILTKNSVVLSLKAKSKKQALEEMAGYAADATGVSDRQIFDVLLERERLGTTGIGNGIAIPHGKLPQLDDLFGCFARLDEPVDFDSIDNEPVDLIFLLLAPESAGADHLKALARISRVLRNNASCDKLRTALTSGDVYELLIHDAHNRAA